MSHVKFSSVPVAWTAAYFMDELAKTLKLEDKEVDLIKLIHIDIRKNQMQHVRLSFYKSCMIDRIKEKGRRTRNRNVFSFKIADKTILCEIMASSEERFKLQRTGYVRGQYILLINMKNNENIKNIAKLLCDKFKIRFEYISLHNMRSFIKVENESVFKVLVANLKRENYYYKISETYLHLETHEENLMSVNDNRDVHVRGARNIDSDFGESSRNNNNMVAKVVNNEQEKRNNNNLAADMCAKMEEMSKKLSEALARNERINLAMRNPSLLQPPYAQESFYHRFPNNYDNVVQYPPHSYDRYYNYYPRPPFY